MKRLTAPEREHIKAQGDAFDRALQVTTLIARQDMRLVGLDKIRKPLAFQAALKATGLETAAFVMPVTAGKPTVEITDIAADIFNRAVTAARALRVPA